MTWPIILLIIGILLIALGLHIGSRPGTAPENDAGEEVIAMFYILVGAILLVAAGVLALLRS